MKFVEKNTLSRPRGRRPGKLAQMPFRLAAVSREQLREGSALSNRDFDSTTAGVCVTVRRGMPTAAHVAARPGLLGTLGRILFRLLAKGDSEWGS
jgi:hypothetical protein